MAWYDEAVFYHIYPLGLCGCAHENDGQPTPGAFAKLEAWAAHAAKLGCTAIYIGPLFESGSHGYDTIDYRLVDRRLGTNEEFKAFVAACLGKRSALCCCCLRCGTSPATATRWPCLPGVSTPLQRPMPSPPGPAARWGRCWPGAELCLSRQLHRAAAAA